MSGPFTSPTPWLHRNSGGTETVVDRTGGTVAILGRGCEPGNGVVIAEAPTMLAALRELFAAVTSNPGAGATADAVNHARAVLAKVDAQ